MAMLIKQSTTTFHVVFLMVDSTDHITGKASASPSVSFSKNAGSFTGANGAVTEISSGWYKVAGNATDTNTLGVLALHATGTGADPTDMIVGQVVAFDPSDAVRLGLTAMPNAAAGASGGLPLSADASGRVDVLKVNGTSQTARDLGNALPTAAPNAAGGLPTFGSGAGQLNVSSGKVSIIGDVRIRKNIALNNFMFRMTDSTDHLSPKAGLGAGITCQMSLDGAAFGAMTNAAAEISNGWYKINLAAGDVNADVVAFKFTAAGADQLDISIITQTE